MTGEGAPMASTFGLSQIGQIAIVVHDTDRAVAFYQEKLGIRLLFRAGPLAFFDAGGVRLMLTPAEKPEFDHAASILYFTVPDLREAYDALRSRGVQFEDEPHLVAKLPDREVWMCFFRDCENNLMGLMSEPKTGLRA